MLFMRECIMLPPSIDAEKLK